MIPETVERHVGEPADLFGPLAKPEIPLLATSTRIRSIPASDSRPGSIWWKYSMNQHLRHSKSSAHAFPALGYFVLLASFVMGPVLLSSCDRPAKDAPLTNHAPAAPEETPDKTETARVPTEYQLDSQPISPTLPHLFDQGHLVVLPAEHPPVAPPSVTMEKYAFSAIDRFGRVYHFDNLARWWMAEGQTLPEPLPAGEWDAAWNPRSKAIEVLVTAPYAGQRSAQVLTWRTGHWARADVTAAPPARVGARRLFATASGHWILAGGKTQGQVLADGWMLEGTSWNKWGPPGGEAAGSVPDLARILFLIDGPAPGDLALLTQTGELWLLSGGAWKQTNTLKTENLCLATYAPALNQVLFVWARGLGQDQFLWLPFKSLEKKVALEPQSLVQTALVKVNEDDEGLWKGMGRARTVKDANGQSRDAFSVGFAGEGEPAISISGEYDNAIYRRSQIKLLELPPQLPTVRMRSALYVPALEGMVAPSVAGLGIEAGRQAFFPPEADRTTSFTTAVTSTTTTTALTRPAIDVIERNYRFWIFKEKWLEWLKPPYEIHPAIDYPNSYRMPDGRRRCLSWDYPEPGLLRYEFYEFHNQKVQWVHSPLLTLRMIPQLAMSPQEEIYTCDPVVWGDPAEVIVIGWCGRLRPQAEGDKQADGQSGKAYAQVPNRGFMARISALEPTQWRVAPLALPFCQGAQLVVAPAQNSLFLLGGKMASAQQDDKGRQLNLMVSHSFVWHWDGEGWHRIDPKGVEPRMKVTSHVTYDPASQQLLSLMPRALYGFDTELWHCLWQRQKEKGERWPDDVGLYLHPQSNLIVGAWFMPQPTLKVWQGSHWIPVQMQGKPVDSITSVGATLEPSGPLPDISDNLLPATEPDKFISIHAGKLAAMRMDVRRNREEDRLLDAHLLSFRPANQGTFEFGRSTLPLESTKEAPAGAKGLSRDTNSTATTTTTSAAASLPHPSAVPATGKSATKM